jgi:hypothetical protein
MKEKIQEFYFFGIAFRGEWFVRRESMTPSVVEARDSNRLRARASEKTIYSR